MRSATRERGFTLVEAIVVIVLTGTLASIVAVFIAGPVMGYMGSTRRAELSDAADTALRRLGRDLRLALPNSLRRSGDGRYIEFMPIVASGRYRVEGSANAYCATPGDDRLDFAAADNCFQILGPPLAFAGGDRIVIGSTQSDGAQPYLGETSSAHIRRAYNGALGTPVDFVSIASSARLPTSAALPGSRFRVVAAAMQAVTYACEGVAAAPAGGDGPGVLRRYWGYGFNPAQATPPAGGSSALLVANVSACDIQYRPTDALVTVMLQLTRAGESLRLYHEIHIDNTP